jgi:hypothetical protein
MNFETLVGALTRQKQFSDLFFDSDEMTIKEKEEVTKTFTLALHAEASGMASAINFKDHRQVKNEVDYHKILFKSVDAFRYVLAILNLWGVKPEDFETACEAKDLYLHMRHDLENNVWSGQSVVLVDVDDVLAHFRKSFFEWLRVRKGIDTPVSCPEYYNVADVLAAGLAPEQVFREFIDDNGFLILEENTTMIDVINKLKDDGYWIHLVTARPADNLKCYHDSYMWLSQTNLKFDAIEFTGEKFRWLADQEFYKEGKVVCAVDDSPKHSTEYAKHGVQVFSPTLSYNTELENVELVTLFTEEDDLYDLIKRFDV